MTCECPWCHKKVEPVPTDLAVAVFVYTDPFKDKGAKARNPWMCPECNGVGGWVDFQLDEPKELT